MSRETFYLKPHIIEAITHNDETIFPTPPPHINDIKEHINDWKEFFPDVNQSILVGAARLFPATSPEVFSRWLQIRSDISPKDEEKELICQDEPERYVLFPLKDEKMWSFRKKIEELSWTAQEIVLSDDSNDLKKVSDGDRRLLQHVLGFFGIADEFIMNSIDEVISKLLLRKEGQFYLKAQDNQEAVHAEAYLLQIQEIIPSEERSDVFDAVKTNPIVSQMADWVRWWTIAEHPAADIFTTMAFLEGVLFSGFFATLQHYKVQNLFPGITSMNEFISRDEGIHSLFWCFIINERLEKRPDNPTINQIAQETVRLSELFFKNAIPKGIIGLNANLLNQYVHYVADTVLVQLKQEAFYNDDNPFGFMDMLALNEVEKVNFFEARPTQYQNLGRSDSLAFSINGMI